MLIISPFRKYHKYSLPLGLLLLIWIKLNPNMDKIITCPVKCGMKLLIQQPGAVEKKSICNNKSRYTRIQLGHKHTRYYNHI